MRTPQSIPKPASKGQNEAPPPRRAKKASELHSKAFHSKRKNSNSPSYPPRLPSPSAASPAKRVAAEGEEIPITAQFSAKPETEQ